MDLGMVGLGRMGANMARRLKAGGHRVVGYDSKPEALDELGNDSIELADSLADLVGKVGTDGAFWLMVPAGDAVDSTIEGLRHEIRAGSVIIDGGNSNYKDAIRRMAELKSDGVALLDVGTSGGIWGARNGYCLTIGGTTDVVARLKPIFESLAPAPDRGWGHVGPTGAGHFVKMIHNGIEYGMMQAYAEGFAILREKKEFDLDLHKIVGLWNQSSVIRSWLLELTGKALESDAELTHIGSSVEDSGEGRWALAEAVDLDVAAPIITLSLIARLQSRDTDSFSNKLLAALRNQFGGHDATPRD
jgi:6-phosphogluconate dehydrogenase